VIGGRGALVETTERLELREFSVCEAERFFELNADPEVLRHTGDRSFVDVAEARDFLSAYDRYQRDGFGRWSVYLRATGAYAGWCGLSYRVDLDEVDLGFRFYRQFWGQGIATESARASLALGFERFGLRQIVGRARADNPVSHRVLQKIGMLRSHDLVDDGQTWTQYRLLVDDFRAPGSR
jgi:[ribosomal protein S5]-alanine N-acetyltransferase